MPHDPVAQLAAIIRERTGLDVSGHRRDDLLRAIAQLEPLHGSIERLCEEPPYEDLVRLLTIGETSFFRHPEQFQLLASRILPALIARRRAEGSLRLHLWSAACATGEEPHSIALILTQLLPDLAFWTITLRATDLNSGFLAAARGAAYGEWSFRGCETWVRSRFTRNGKRWQLDEDVRKLVAFEALNLAVDDYPTDVDVIFCRNVLIYFDAETRMRVLTRLRDALSPDGWLIVGHADLGADSVPGLEPAFETESFVYRRKLECEGDASAFECGPPASRRLTSGHPARAATREERASPAPCRRDGPSAAAGTAALRRLQKTRRSEPDAHSLFETAARLLDRGEEDAAADALRRSLYLDPRQPAAHYLAGLIAERRGSPRNAYRHFRAAMVTLSTLDDGTIVSGTDGITAGRLRDVLGTLLEESAHA